MEYAAWAPEYARIASEFGFSLEREAAAADRLDVLLPVPDRADPLGRAAARLEGKTVIVVGQAPGSGPPPVWRLPLQQPTPVLVAADGATARCLDAGLVPEVIVTDLDGPVPSETNANRRGSLVVVHAHGDNVEAMERWVPEFPGELAGSWAGPPRPALLNVGGFTDGDRAAFLAEHVGAARILLWGFDFDRVDESDPEGAARKQAKLRVAHRLLLDLARFGRCPIFEWHADGSLAAYPSSR